MDKNKHMIYINRFYSFNERVGGVEISSMDKYITGMMKSIQDKLFFIDKIDTDLIVDFGCADGSIISEIKRRRSDIDIIGYDIDDNMLNMARYKNKDCFFTNSWDDVISRIDKYNSPCLNLSSVIHEVYSYSNSRIIKKFWEKNVFGSGFKWITIRDMIPSIKISKDINFESDVKKIKNKSDKYLKSFEDRWGPIDYDYRTFTHYLLKYKFKENWEREVKENYLPLTLETLKKKIPNSYKIVYEDNFILDHIKSEVLKDFGVLLRHPTHSKLIIKNN